MVPDNLHLFVLETTLHEDFTEKFMLAYRTTAGMFPPWADPYDVIVVTISTVVEAIDGQPEYILYEQPLLKMVQKVSQMEGTYND